MGWKLIYDNVLNDCTATNLNNELLFYGIQAVWVSSSTTIHVFNSTDEACKLVTCSIHDIETTHCLKSDSSRNYATCSWPIHECMHTCMMLRLNMMMTELFMFITTDAFLPGCLSTRCQNFLSP